MNKNTSIIKKIFGRREILLIAVLIAASIIISFFSPVFLKKTNLLSILMSITVEGLVAVGMVMLLALGEMDLSVGMVMAFTGVITGLFLTKGIPVVLAIILGLLIACGIGAFNGILVAKIGLNSFITTLGVQCALQGLMLVFSNGRSVTGLPAAFNKIGQGTVFGVQFPIIILFVIVIVMDILMRNLRAMRQIYYIGSNEKAAKLNGINVARVKIICFIACSLIAGLAGLLITARFGAASVTIGGDTPMDCITACIIGGASLKGGKGTVWGAVLGALFLATISTSLNLLGVNIYWQNFVTGAILILAILIDVISENRKAAGKTAL